MTSLPVDPRTTEQPNPRSAAIDLASPLEIVDIMQSEDATVAAAVATQREAIARAIDFAERALRAGGRLVYLGAGTSGRLGVLDAAECPPTFGTDPAVVQAIIAGGAAALLQAQEGVEDDAQAAVSDIAARNVGPNDFVVGIAASGTTPFVHAGLAEAKRRGAATALVACTSLSLASDDVVDVPIVVVTGPEVLTGSTRLKAGTATKMVLNIISTGVMIRLGKTFGNLMVDLRATNAKLRDRTERILMEICSVDRPVARDLLKSAGGRLKVAIVMGKLSVGLEEAERALEAAGGNVRRVTSTR
ncbi:N-acetylmuramic acid 6-phosphate etherase [Usitatibacter palustris]|uniref:N-acetylmuramic acid 6-phosphate etherase n=1 Tax=Usitatibacter palustris TaxID=2732487 RepID=A0A6M4H7W8_9PROT|nr:N-acetylmuramic acid 6-phosphate etherase [Usitatibacter palustris]QJR14793.1 N-acetylmuramic acid 6-phosphate etherase [Usitatibacter palustris]